MHKPSIVKHIATALFAFAALTVGREASAGGHGRGAHGHAAASAEWGLHNGNTMNPGGFMPYLEVGWPDVAVGMAYGITSNFDIGARVAFSYSPYYSTATATGMSARVPLRFGLMRNERTSLLIHADPGIKIASFSPMFFSVQIPIGAEFGLHLSDDATLSIGVEAPIDLNLTKGTAFLIAPMGGPGFEYHIGKHIAVGAFTRFGAAVAAGGSTVTLGKTAFGMQAQGYFAYRL